MMSNALRHIAAAPALDPAPAAALLRQQVSHPQNICTTASQEQFIGKFRRNLFLTGQLVLGRSFPLYNQYLNAWI